MKRILISRTDNLGDVILTLPMAGVLKHHFPEIEVLFLGKNYTAPLIQACIYVDHFLDLDEMSSMNHDEAARYIRELNLDAVIFAFPEKSLMRLFRDAGVPIRISASGRLYAWFLANRRVMMSRYRSDFHEAQLNLKLLSALDVVTEFRLDQIQEYYGFDVSRLNGKIDPAIFISGKFKLILHPKSKGSAREWGLDNFAELIRLLPEDRFQIFVTGTEQEGERMKDFMQQEQNRIVNLCGKMSLQEFILFISCCDGLVAASTGPLHIAAAMGKKAIGLYAPMRPIFPKRWAPLGRDAHYLVKDKECKDCRKSGNCHCIREISPQSVADLLMGT